MISYPYVAQKINTGEIDLAIGGFIPGQEHGRNLKWSKSYLKANFCLVVPAHSDIQDIDDLKEGDITVGVYDEPYVKLWLKKYLPNAKYKAYSYPNWFECIKNFEVDVIINDYPYAVESMKHHPELKFANYHLSESDVGYSICLPDNNELKAFIDRALDKIMKTEEYSSIHKKYLYIKDSFLHDKYKTLPYQRVYKASKSDDIRQIAREFLGNEDYWNLIFNINKHVLPNPFVIDEGITLHIPEKKMSTNFDSEDEKWMRMAIDFARKGMLTNEGGPFGAIIVKDGNIVGVGNNKVTSSNDPTAHAEIVAIRNACKNLGTFQLDDCIIYTSCEPCPMCLGAIYWARPKKIFFGCNRHDAADINFDDNFIYEEINTPHEYRGIKTLQILREEALKVFHEWDNKEDKKEY